MAGPNLPEPSTWAMLLLGFAGLAFMGIAARASPCKRGIPIAIGKAAFAATPERLE